MLCQFTFRNFKSYRDEAVLDMQAANIEEFSDSLIPAPGKKFSELLPIAALFGPNAGGKSNAIEALAYLISCVTLPIRAATGNFSLFTMALIRYAPFLLDANSKEAPTEFEIFFRTKSAQYQYLLSIKDDEVQTEALYYLKTPCERRRVNCLFMRKKGEITLGAALRGANVQQVSAKIPYLSFLAINYNFLEVEEAIRWFQNCYVISYTVSGQDHTFFDDILESKIVKPKILNLLQDMDIPIADFKSSEKTAEDGRKERRILTTHVVGSNSYQLELNDESEGTRKIFSVLPSIVLSLSQGGVFVVDELDAKLHPQLLRYLIRLYTNPNTNPNHAQLVFTCHDLAVMKNDLLRRDEIWFAARNGDSASELWSLYDLQDEKGERVKNTAAYDKQYLAGRYGADPYLRRMMYWGDMDGKESKTT